MSEITVTQSFSQSAPVVWALLSDLSKVVDYHPIVNSVDLLTDHVQGMGATRRCHFLDGTSLLEEVIDLREGERFTLSLTEGTFPMRDIRATLEVQPLAQGGSRVVFTIGYVMKYGLAGAILERLMLRRKLAENMQGMLEGVAQHLQTGRRVAA